jgi:predicted CXXCH cytochrome family protein
MKKALMLVVFATLVVPKIWAGKHPVALDPKGDAATCVQCHEAKTKGKSVHTAMSLGCLSCHEVRVIKSKDKKREDVTRVKLIKPTPTAQCLTCHEAKKTGSGNSRVHAPVTRNCLTCHDPHVSEIKNQLKKAASGEAKENLCLTCHNEGVNVSKGGSRHAALDTGCDTCHVTHKTGAADQRENRVHLVKDAPALCVDCHDVNDAALTKAHRNQPFQKADCLACHDPHQSAKPKLAQRFQHTPFESGACDSCHAEAKDGKVVLTGSDTRAVCVTCHDEQAKKIEKAKVQHPGAQGECVACHSPHASKFDRLMNPDPVKVCENCHADKAAMHKKEPVLHHAAFTDGCFTCHSGHGGDRPKLLRAEGNKLCLECHSPQRRPIFNAETQTIGLFGNAVRMPAGYFLTFSPLNLRSGDTAGHPTGTHPVSAAVDRSDPDKKRAMGCMSCHKPHAGKRALLVTDTLSSLTLCSRCHAGMLGADTAPEGPVAPTTLPGQAAPSGKKKVKK